MIICLSGKKRSGKNTAVNFIIGYYLKHRKFISDFKIEDNGWLTVQKLSGEWHTYPESYKGDYGTNDRIKVYSFADALKEFCINVFGLTYDQCYGTDEDKTSLSCLAWGNMPTYADDKQIFEQNRKESISPNTIMTAREVLQYFGTNIIRRMSDNAWVDATLRGINRNSAVQLALITDARFPNEVDSVLEAGEKVIRLLRNVAGADEHESEKALDNYPLERYSGVIRNEQSTIAQQNAELEVMIRPWLAEL